jgi:DNA repair exonuclease SbcCD ATPase subunit
MVDQETVQEIDEVVDRHLKNTQETLKYQDLSGVEESWKDKETQAANILSRIEKIGNNLNQEIEEQINGTEDTRGIRQSPVMSELDDKFVPGDPEDGHGGTYLEDDAVATSVQKVVNQLENREGTQVEETVLYDFERALEALNSRILTEDQLKRDLRKVKLSVTTHQQLNIIKRAAWKMEDEREKLGESLVTRAKNEGLEWIEEEEADLEQKEANVLKLIQNIEENEERLLEILETYVTRARKRVEIERETLNEINRMLTEQEKGRLGLFNPGKLKTRIENGAIEGNQDLLENIVRTLGSLERKSEDIEDFSEVEELIDEMEEYVNQHRQLLDNDNTVKNKADEQFEEIVSEIAPDEGTKRGPKQPETLQLQEQLENLIEAYKQQDILKELKESHEKLENAFEDVQKVEKGLDRKVLSILEGGEGENNLIELANNIEKTLESDYEELKDKTEVGKAASKNGRMGEIKDEKGKRQFELELEELDERLTKVAKIINGLHDGENHVLEEMSSAEGDLKDALNEAEEVLQLIGNIQDIRESIVEDDNRGEEHWKGTFTQAALYLYGEGGVFNEADDPVGKLRNQIRTIEVSWTEEIDSYMRKVQEDLERFKKELNREDKELGEIHKDLEKFSELETRIEELEEKLLGIEDLKAFRPLTEDMEDKFKNVKAEISKLKKEDEELEREDERVEHNVQHIINEVERAHNRATRNY